VVLMSTSMPSSDISMARFFPPVLLGDASAQNMPAACSTAARLRIPEIFFAAVVRSARARLSLCSSKYLRQPQIKSAINKPCQNALYSLNMVQNLAKTTVLRVETLVRSWDVPNIGSVLHWKRSLFPHMDAKSVGFHAFPFLLLLNAIQTEISDGLGCRGENPVLFQVTGLANPLPLCALALRFAA
jgi:hypothetical protein